jgi:hypothetical protein
MSIVSSAATRVRLGLVFLIVAAVLVSPTGCSGQSNAPSDPPNVAAGNGSTAGGNGPGAGNDSGGGNGSNSGNGSTVGEDGSTAGNGVAAGAAGDGGTSGTAGSGAVSWCQAYKLINCVCQQCHQNPTLHGAAMPLMTFEDTQVPFPYPTSTATVWQTMQGVIANRFMPYTGDSSVMPLVKPLTDEQRGTLLAWLAQGATAAGGAVCPMTCDWSKGPPTGPF